MNKLYITKADGIHERLNGILFELFGFAPNISRTENGKPYIEGNPLFFSISHSGEHGVIAISNKPVGVDLEIFKGKDRLSFISRFCEQEQLEIASEKDFLFHWTAREAFIKMRGSTLAKDLKNTAYYGGNLYFEGNLQSCILQKHTLPFGVVTVCIDKDWYNL